MLASGLTLAYLALVGASLAFATWEVVLLVQYVRLRRRTDAPPPPRPFAGPLPVVTVQVPLFNERFVAARVLRAVAALDYPRDRLEVQVLDDSTDVTRAIVADEVERLRADGLSVELVHREERTGFKAGALAHGLARARGELVAVFDADFAPEPSFLRRLIVDEAAFDDPRLGFVQARWDYTNRDEGPLTRVQALMIDRYFLVQNPARVASGFVVFFNGSGGLWRRECIDDAGGWAGDTLTEDLDLSYRAALRGWRGRYVPSVTAPSELPADLLAFKRQQRRWARGTAQSLRKLGPALLGASWSLGHRLAELLTVAGYHLHLLLLLNVLLWPPVVFLVEPRFLAVSQVALTPAFLVAPLGFVLAWRARGGGPLRPFLADLGLALLVGQGVALSNTAALAAGHLRRRTGTFERTPKGTGSAPGSDAYAIEVDWTFGGEVALAVYCAAGFVALVATGHWLWAPPLLVWALSFGTVAVWQLAPARRDAVVPVPEAN